MNVLTTCPRCTSEDVQIVSEVDFNSTTITVTPCQFDDPTAASIIYRKSAVLEAEANNEAVWSNRPALV